MRSARLICSIPGIDTLTAEVIVAETGGDMTRFPTAKHLVSWAGTTPGSNKSAGKVNSSRTRPGNPYLQGTLGAAAMACAQNPRTYLGAKYRRISTRGGPQKANVAGHQLTSARRPSLMKRCVTGLRRMVADDRSCLDILAQIAAVTHAFQAVAVALASHHLCNSAHPAIQEAHGDPHGLSTDIGRVRIQLLRP